MVVNFCSFPVDLFETSVYIFSRCVYLLCTQCWALNGDCWYWWRTLNKRRGKMYLSVEQIEQIFFYVKILEYADSVPNYSHIVDSANASWQLRRCPWECLLETVSVWIYFNLINTYIFNSMCIFSILWSTVFIIQGWLESEKEWIILINVQCQSFHSFLSLSSLNTIWCYAEYWHVYACLQPNIRTNGPNAVMHACHVNKPFICFRWNSR